MTVAMILIVIFIGIPVFAATKPDTISIQRAAEIKAPPERIFALIADFHHWKDWAPQDRMDSTMQRSYGGPSSGLGAFSEWKSKGNAGRGRMEIVEAQAPLKLTVRVDFTKPFQARNINQFTLEPVGGMTRVSWAMRGTSPYVVKLMSVFFDMERIMGRHFEAGLQSLKALAEQQGPA